MDMIANVDAALKAGNFDPADLPGMILMITFLVVLAIILWVVAWRDR